MGRLIDADKLMQDIRNTITEQSNTIDWLNLVNRQPIAYDVDKVVEQLYGLKKYGNKYDSYWDSSLYQMTEFENKTINDAVEKAIEIVKGECATEQSCEWKLEDLESNLYVTGCENRQLIFEGTPEENGYKYCNYCGRKIKRGGVDGN